MIDTGTVLIGRMGTEADRVGPLLDAPTARGLSESDREAAVRLSKLAGAVVSLAVAAPFGAPAVDDPAAVVRAALELALLDCSEAP